MSVNTHDEMRIGVYSGKVATEFNAPDFLSALERINRLIADPKSTLISTGRNATYIVRMQSGGVDHDFVVKSFGGQSFIKDSIDSFRGSKAKRTWSAARHLRAGNIGTPMPVAFLERREGVRLKESYYISVCEKNMTSFKDELIALFKKEPDCSRMMSLLKTVAEAVAGMHKAGFLHNDLGNQNIFLRRKSAGEWGDVQFLDLNRGAILKKLSLKQRARDISRIYLPSDLLRVFKEMYFLGEIPPHSFDLYERHFRRRYALHSISRSLRHPLRTYKNREYEKTAEKYPDEKDMWIWDSKSVQPIVIMRPKERKKHYSVRRTSRIVMDTLCEIPGIWMKYRGLLKGSYKEEVGMADRIGMSVGPDSGDMEKEIDLMSAFPGMPVLVRFNSHDTSASFNNTVHLVSMLRNKGHSVSIALIQDRASVLSRDRWRDFVKNVIGAVGDSADYIEICHAINRVKWGIWNFKEHRMLLETVRDEVRGKKDIRLTGPAVIDFEYPFVVSALKNIPEGLRFSALSHHLYIDRRGAPENRQNGFSALEKFALLKAVARNFPDVCDDKVIISEVNWPITGTGVYSPVTCPYQSPGPRFNDPSVSEDDYADYMIRYLLIALCSGMVDRVYWWRLVARGFGLIDDSQSGSWRKRPAYEMLKQFYSMVGQSTFTQHKKSESGAETYIFRRPDGTGFAVVYSLNRVHLDTLGIPAVRVIDAFGRELDINGSIEITSRPVYLAIEN